MIDFQNLSYLQKGNARQQKAYQILISAQIWEKLAPFNPLLAGTVPLGIDTPKSDLDILCEVYDFEYFQEILFQNFGHYPHYVASFSEAQKQEAFLASFQIQSCTLEIFGQSCPSAQQWAFRHLCIEYRILQVGGLVFQEKVKALKVDGYKTEPAFALLLQLKGNPYTAILDLENYSQEELKQLMEKL